jgi:S1-C subfamily serine protease
MKRMFVLKKFVLLALTLSFVSSGCISYQMVRFETIPDKADLYVNGIPQEKTPVTVKLVTDAAGTDFSYRRHIIIAKMEGYQDETLVLQSPSYFWSNTKPFPDTITLKLRKITSDKSSTGMGTSWPIKLGYVVTNHHIIEGHEKISLIRPDGKKISATVLVSDKINDIVLLKVANTKELPPALPIALVKPGIGAKVFTIGYPHTDILGAKPKLTDGLISSVSGFQDDPRTFQITVPVQAGNSGGPLLNLNGEVVGIVTSKLDAIRVFRWTGDLPQNVSYAVKISYLNALIDSVTEQNYPINELIRESGDLEQLAKRIQDSVMIVLAE